MLPLLWIVFGLLLLVWTGLAAGIDRLLHWPADGGDLLLEWVSALGMASGLDTWLPGWREGLRELSDLLQAIAQALESAAPWLSAALWLAWGVGTVLILALTIVLHLAIRAPTSRH